MIDRYISVLNTVKDQEDRREALLGIQEFLKESGYLLASGEHGYDVIAPEDIEDKDFKEFTFFGFVGDVFRILSNAEVRKMR